MKHLLKTLFGVVHEFEVDPVAQYRFHLFMTWSWLAVMLYVPQVHAFKGQAAALLIMEVSLWANFVSHFTAVGASLAGIIAAHRESELRNSPLRGLLGLIWHKKIKAAKFSNPNYRPPNTQTIGAVSTPPAPSGTEAMPGSLGVGWNDQDNAGMESAGVADF